MALSLAAATTASAAPVALGDLLAQSPAKDWRLPDADNTLYLELPGGRVVIELAPRVAPLHVANIKALVRAGYFDGHGEPRAMSSTVLRSVSSPRPSRIALVTEGSASASAVA